MDLEKYREIWKNNNPKLNIINIKLNKTSILINGILLRIFFELVFWLSISFFLVDIKADYVIKMTEHGTYFILEVFYYSIFIFFLIRIYILYKKIDYTSNTLNSLNSIFRLKSLIVNFINFNLFYLFISSIIILFYFLMYAESAQLFIKQKPNFKIEFISFFILLYISFILTFIFVLKYIYHKYYGKELNKIKKTIDYLKKNKY
jgi:hypothetical protein